jgi:PAS domain S-box-containing protein
MRELDELEDFLVRIGGSRLSDEDRKAIQDRFGYTRDALALLEVKYLEALRDRAVIHSLLKNTSEDLLHRYRAIFEYSGTAMVVLERDGIISLANSYFENLMGSSRSDIEGKKKFSEFADNRLNALVGKFLSPEGEDDPDLSQPGEGRITGNDNKTFEVFVRIGRFPETGQCVLSLIDVTARKQAEAELRDNREYLSRIFTSLKAGIMIIDAKTHEIVDVNDAAAGLIGIEPREIVGKVCHRYICPAQVGKCPITDLNQTIDNAERLLINAQDVRVPIIKHVVPLTLHGRDCLLETFIDNTDRQRAEEALRQANRKLSLLSGITRHDIKNQVTIVDGFLSILKMKSENPAMKKYCEMIESASRDIREQIEFTKIYEDLGTHEPQWQGLEKVLPRSSVPGNITLESKVQGAEVYADPMLEKVFFNLLDNAIRHGEHVSRITVSCIESPDGLELVWEDNGTGVAMGEKELIFERGFGKNTGLGLFLVREILSLTGMTIRETGTEGTGARFEIQVPPASFRFSTT